MHWYDNNNDFLEHLSTFLYIADIDECATHTDNCGAPLICNNTIGGFFCRCPEGLVLSTGSNDSVSYHLLYLTLLT